MKEVLSKIRTDGKVVSEIAIPQFESTAEIQQGFTEAVIVEKFNRIHKIDVQGEERNKYVPARVGKEKKRLMAYNLCTADELMATVGDNAKLTALLDSKLPLVEAQLSSASA